MFGVVIVVVSGGDRDGMEILYIAMAGTHQIWAFFLQDGKWLRGRYWIFLEVCGKGLQVLRLFPFFS